MIRDLVDIKMLTSIASSRFAEEVVATMVENGSYRKLVDRLGRRLEGQQVAVQKMMGAAGWEIFSKPNGGLFVWARRAGVHDSTMLVESAAGRQVSLSAGTMFTPDLSECPWLRINVAYATEPRALAYLSEP